MQRQVVWISFFVTVAFTVLTTSLLFAVNLNILLAQ